MRRETWSLYSTWLGSSIRHTGCPPSVYGTRCSQSIRLPVIRGDGSRFAVESQGGSLGFTLSCKGDDLKGFARRLFDVVDDLGSTAGIEDFATALAPLAANVVVRGTSSAPHVAALDAARSAVRRLAMFSRVEQTVGAERAEAVTLLLIAIADRFTPARRHELTAVAHEAEHDEPLAAELANLRAQLGALWSITSDSSPSRIMAR